MPDEPVRCGIAAGGFGSQYAIAGGCAARVSNRVHLNGAIAYTPSVDYHYGSTASFAGRVGVSFPIGVRSSKSSQSTQTSQIDWSKPQGETTSTSQDSAPPVQPLWYRTEVKQEISQLQSDVASRDQEIEQLKSKLELMIAKSSESNASSSMILQLKQRLAELEEQKQASDNALKTEIQALKDQLAEQQRRFDQLMNQLQASDS